MIINQTVYEDFVKNLMKKSNIYKLRQIMLCLKNSFEGMTDEVARSIVYAVQKQGYCLISKDGWVLSKGLYQYLFDDRLFDKLSTETEDRIPFCCEDVCSNYKEAFVNSLWIIADFMPSSEQFCECNSPFTYSFIREGEKKNNLIEICYFKHATADITAELVKMLPEIKSDSLKASIKRIAIVEDPSDKVYVPYLGFSHIVRINENKKSGYEVVEKREKDSLWI